MVQYVREQGSQKVVVHLEFPKQSDKEAEDEFISRIKEIYLRKIKKEIGQGEETALKSNLRVDEGDTRHKPIGSNSSTQAGENYE